LFFGEFKNNKRITEWNKKTLHDCASKDTEVQSSLAQGKEDIYWRYLE
jgi:hypothetical protein